MLAQFFLESVPLHEVWFVVSPHNPLKEKSSLLPAHHRLMLVKKAIENQPKFRASDVEFHLSQPSYTVHTLAHLSEQYPRKKFALIMGEDNLATLSKWKNHAVILNEYPLLVYPRIKTEANQKTEHANHPNVHFYPAPVIGISSSMIREMIAQKKDVRFFMNEPAYEYLKEMHFYE